MGIVELSWRTPSEDPMSWLLGLLIGCFAIGLVLLLSRSAIELGVALVVGALFAAAAYLTQMVFENRTYQTSLVAASELRGFDDLGHDLSDTTLSGKDMRNSRLADARLERANLAYTRLGDTVLTDADLHGAILFHADLTGADLRGADLGETNLRSTTFVNAVIASTDLDRARTDLGTCWPVALEEDGTTPTDDGRSLLARLAKSAIVAVGQGDGQPMPETIGHVCDSNDLGGDKPATRLRVCRDGTLVSAPTGIEEQERTDTCEQRAD